MTKPERRAAHARALDLATGAFRTDVLAAACALALPEALSDGAHTVAQLSASLELPEPGLELLLNACCAIGVALRRKREYSLPPGIDALLGRGARGDLRAAIRNAAGESARAQALAAAVRRGQGAAGVVTPVLDRLASTFTACAPDVAPLAELGGRTSLLDLTEWGGGLSISHLRRHPVAAATVVESADRADAVRDAAANAGVADRLRVVAPGAAANALGCGYDAVIIGRALRTPDESLAMRILAGCRRRLAADGMLCVVDTVLDADRAGPPLAALLALELWASASPARVRTRDELGALLVNAGFRDVRDRAVGPLAITSLIGARA